MQVLIRWPVVVASVLALTALTPAAALDLSQRTYLTSSSFLDATHLVDVRQGTELSRSVSSLRGGRFELANGVTVKFSEWYSTKWTDLRITWMTQLTPNVGLLFGLSTGEKGEKYRIDPSLKLGLVAQTQIAKDAFLSFRVTSILGGRLREKTCTADYGDIGGVQEVNCRLAASTLPPAETLRYLLDQKPDNRRQFAVNLTWRF